MGSENGELNNVEKPDEGGETVDAGDLSYPDGLLEITILMESGGRDKQRHERRPLAETLANCGDPELDYIFYKFDVTKDGITVMNAGVRKTAPIASIGRGSNDLFKPFVSSCVISSTDK